MKLQDAQALAEIPIDDTLVSETDDDDDDEDEDEEYDQEDNQLPELDDGVGAGELDADQFMA